MAYNNNPTNDAYGANTGSTGLGGPNSGVGRDNQPMGDKIKEHTPGMTSDRERMQQGAVGGAGYGSNTGMTGNNTGMTGSNTGMTGSNTGMTGSNTNYGRDNQPMGDKIKEHTPGMTSDRERMQQGAVGGAGYAGNNTTGHNTGMTGSNTGMTGSNTSHGRDDQPMGDKIKEHTPGMTSDRERAAGINSGPGSNTTSGPGGYGSSGTGVDGTYSGSGIGNSANTSGVAGGRTTAGTGVDGTYSGSGVGNTTAGGVGSTTTAGGVGSNTTTGPGGANHTGKDSTTGKLMEKAGGLFNNEKMVAQGHQKREEAARGL